MTMSLLCDGSDVGDNLKVQAYAGHDSLSWRSLVACVRLPD